MASNSHSGRFYTGGFPPICHPPPEPLERHTFPDVDWIHGWVSWAGQTLPGSPWFHAEGPILLTWTDPPGRWIGLFRNPINPANQIRLEYYAVGPLGDFTCLVIAIRNGAVEADWTELPRPPRYADPFHYGQADYHSGPPAAWDSACDVYL